jgi:N-succinyldiaminopimelate aminotransferase
MTTTRAASRVAGLGTTVFAEMTALAAATGSVNLGQGFPDTDGPTELLERAVAAIRSGRNQYPPGDGVPELRAAISADRLRRYGLAYDPAGEVLVTTGATEAIAGAVLGLVEPGDEVVALEPYYDSYAAMIAMAGGVRVPLTLRAPRYRLDVHRLRGAVSSRTKVVLLNSPHNPTGAVLTGDELAAVAAVAVENDLVVVSDEVYEHLVFAGASHVPIATLPGMRERTLGIGSAGKTFSVTGWKVGWVTGPRELVSAVRAVKQFLTYTSGAPFQPAVAWALEEAGDWVEGHRAALEAQRDLLCAGLAGLGLEVHRPDGTYFVTTDVRPLGWGDGMEFCRALPERAGVVAIPNRVFYDDVEAGRPLVRWAFCKRPQVLDEALRRLGSARLER